MNSMTMLHRGALTRRDKPRVSLFAKTKGKDLRGAEIDEALELCELFQANPFTNDIYFFVFDADKSTRRVVPVMSIGQYRKTAARSGTYRPSDKGPEFTYDPALKGPTNPRGIVDCKVTVWQFSHNEWHPVAGYVRLEERAPIKQIWRNNQPTGEYQLDPKKQNWATMPETMLAKCAEADALRKGWPEQVGGLYVEGELDRGTVIELSASEIVAQGEQEARQARLGGPRLQVQFESGTPLVGVPHGEFHGRVDAFFQKHADEPSVILEWAARNKDVLNDFWAIEPNACLDLKQKIEAAAKVGE